jgi:hypothetical protein
MTTSTFRAPAHSPAPMTRRSDPGSQVLAIGIITDQCLPDALKPVDVPEILRIAAGAEPALTTLFQTVLAQG